MKVAKRQRQQQQHNIKQSSRGLHRAYSRDKGLKLLLDPIKREKKRIRGEKKRKKEKKIKTEKEIK